MDSTINISTTNYFYPCATITQHVCPPCDGFPQQIFSLDNIALFSNAVGCLNDTCINGCVALLYSTFLPAVVHMCAILSTHDLLHVRYNATDEILWSNTSWSWYWEKEIWIIPMHWPCIGHWVLCTADFSSRWLLLFNSLAECHPWKKDVQVDFCLSFSWSNWLAIRILRSLSATYHTLHWRKWMHLPEILMDGLHTLSLYVLPLTFDWSW